MRSGGPLFCAERSGSGDCQAATMPAGKEKSHYGGIEAFGNELTST